MMPKFLMRLCILVSAGVRQKAVSAWAWCSLPGTLKTQVTHCDERQQAAKPLNPNNRARRAREHTLWPGRGAMDLGLEIVSGRSGDFGFRILQGNMHARHRSYIRYRYVDHWSLNLGQQLLLS